MITNSILVLSPEPSRALAPDGWLVYQRDDEFHNPAFWYCAPADWEGPKPWSQSYGTMEAASGICWWFYRK